MNVTDLFKRLSYGPFTNIALGNDGNGTILEAKKPAVIQYVNDALIQLHSRFTLVEKELIVELVEGQTTYDLTTEASDILKIGSVWDQYGSPIPLNQEDDPASVFTPTLTTLQVPTPVDGKPLSIIYQAKPAKLADSPVNMNEIVDIPDVLLPALTSYVAYLAFTGMGSQEHLATAQVHLGAYDNQCMQVIDRDLVNSSISMNDSNKFHDRGFI